MLKSVIFILTLSSPGVFPIGQPLFFLPGLIELYRAQRHGPPAISGGHMNRGHGHHMGHPGHGSKGNCNQEHHGPPPHGHGPPPHARGPPPHARGPPPRGHGHAHPPPPSYDYSYPDYDYELPMHHPKPPNKKTTTVAPITTKSTTTTTTTPATTTSTTPHYGAGEIDVRFGKSEDRQKRSTKSVDPAATTEIQTRYNALSNYPQWNTPGTNVKSDDSESLPGHIATCAQRNYECVPAHACTSQRTRTSNNRRFCNWANDQPFVCCEKQKNEKFQRAEIKCGRGRTGTGLSQAIIGGASVPGASSYPWMTAIGEVLANGDVDWYCGGALVGEKTVVTAAHCIARRTADVIRIGETNLKVNTDDRNSNVQQISVSKALSHPLYRPPALYNDVALLYLEEPVRLTPFARPICLSQSTSTSDTPVALLTGWGMLSFASERSAQLQEVTIQVVNNAYCDSQYSVTQASSRYFPRGILDTLLCAGDDEGGKDACQGDSGAPLVAEEDGDLVLIGIVSAGIGCGSKTFPGVYTRVSAFTPWILENID